MFKYQIIYIPAEPGSGWAAILFDSLVIVDWSAVTDLVSKFGDMTGDLPFTGSLGYTSNYTKLRN